MRGSVVRRGRGYSIVVDIGRDPSTGKRKQKWQGGFHSKKEAEAELARVVNSVEQGTYVNAARTLLSDYLRRWLEAAKVSLAPATYRRYWVATEMHIIPCLGNIPIAKLQPLEIQRFLTDELNSGRRDNKTSVGRGLSPATVRYNYRVLHHALAQAVEWQLLMRNPADFVKTPKPQKKEISVLDEAEVDRLLQSLKGTWLYTPAFLAVFTGMRMGEVLGLTWEDVDFRERVIHVRQASCQRRVGAPQFRQPKTEKSRRSIDVSSTVTKVLREHRTEQLCWRLKAGSAWQDYNLVCSLEDGRPVNPPSLSSSFRTVAARLGMSISFHGLRHTHASLLLKAGVPAKVVSERLGHSGIGLTMDTYSHVMPGMQRDAAERLERMLSL